MLAEVMSSVASTQKSRPLSVGVAGAALVLPSLLVILRSAPELFSQVGLNGVLLLSVAISLPIVLLCYGLWYTLIKALIHAQKRIAGEIIEPPSDLARAMNVDEGLEWPCLLSAGWMANVILYSVAAVSYAYPLRIGATYLLISAVLLGLWVLLFAGAIALGVAVDRRLKSAAAASPSDPRAT